MSDLVPVLSPEQAFREKIRERIFNNLGDLITEERLLALVTEAVQQSLLAPQVVKATNCYGRDSVKESYLCEMVRGEVNKLLTEKIESWFIANREMLEAHFRSAVTDQIGATLVSAFMTVIRAPMEQATFALQSKIQEMVNGRAQ